MAVETGARTVGTTVALKGIGTSLKEIETKQIEISTDLLVR
jgi:hypothetical protein